MHSLSTKTLEGSNSAPGQASPSPLGYIASPGSAEPGSHCIAQAGLELTMKTRLALNFPSSCLNLLGAENTGVGQKTWLEIIVSNRTH